MDERWLQVCDYEGEGFQPLVDFGTWRVAILRSRANTRAAGIADMERHMETDEVFVLSAGRAVLLIGGGGPALEGVFPEPMQLGKVYNIRRAVWHAALLSRDASILIVENQDTSPDNSQYLPLTREQRQIIADIEQQSAI